MFQGDDGAKDWELKGEDPPGSRGFGGCPVGVFDYNGVRLSQLKSTKGKISCVNS